MKKLFTLFASIIILFLLTSCKKSCYICEEVVTQSNTTSTIASKRIYCDISKSEVKSIELIGTYTVKQKGKVPGYSVETTCLKE